MPPIAFTGSASSRRRGAQPRKRARAPLTLLVSFATLIAFAGAGTAAAPAGAATCANEALRYGAGAQLPDCRAYEQVSPVDKNDGDVAYGPRGLAGSIFAPTNVAPDGNLVSFSSFYAFAGNEGAPFLSQYLSARGASGWSTQGISPPKSATFQGIDTHSEYNSFSTDLSHATLLNWAAPGQYSLFRRDADGALTELAAQPPTGQPPSFNGASDDYSKILVSVANEGNKLNLWSDGHLTPLEPAGQNAYAGGASNGFMPWGRAISADGSRVYWHTATARSGLLLREGGADINIAISECDTGRTGETGPGGDCVPPGTSAPGGGTFYAASEDGSAALFGSGELTDDSSHGPNLYLYRVAADGQGHHLTNLTPTAELGPAVESAGPGVEGVVMVSSDLSYVYFVAHAVLATGATEGEPNLYVRHAGTTRFIATLGGTFSELAALMRSSTSPMKRSTVAQVSADGRQLVFVNAGELPGYETAGHSEVYRYDAGTNQLDCLSCNPDRTVAANGDADLGVYEFGAPEGMRFVNVAAGGNRVFFETADALLPRDGNGLEDVYEWEADGTGSCRSAAQNGGCLALVSSGQSDDASWFQGTTPSGDDAFFVTRERLVGQDTDDLMDLYDARVGGGLASQIAPAVASPCGSVESCHAAGPTASSRAAAGTAAFVGNEAPPRATPTFSIQRISKGQRRQLAAGRQIALRVHVSAPGLLRATVQGRLGPHRARTLARGRKRARGAGTVGVHLRLSRAARHYLARHDELRVRVLVRYSGVKRARTRRLTLRRAGRRHRSRAMRLHRHAPGLLLGGRR